MAPGNVNPSAMTVEQAARLLGIEAADVQRHVEQGLPISGDGTIHLLTYLAWILTRLRT